MTNSYKLLVLIFLLTPTMVFGQGQWSPQNPAPMANDFIDIELIDQNTSITLCENGLILKTIDQGSEWDTLFYHEDPLFDFKKIFFLDEQCGWAVSDIIIKTQDGGNSWHLCPTYLDIVNDLFFINQDTGFLAGKEGNKATVLKTINGGDSWTAVLSDSTLWSAFSIYFINESIGCVGGYGKVFKTNDGGLNWFDAGAPINGYTVDYIQFKENNFGIIACRNGKIAKTSDGGISWEMCTEPKMDIRSIYCQDNDHLWLSGNKSSSWEGIVKYTSDGGISWDSIVVEYSTSINAIDFKDNSGWYGGTLGTLYHTKNGGVDWGQISGSITSASLQAIHFINPNMGWISGWSPHILLKTMDGGLNWEEIHDFGEKYMSDLYFTNEDDGWGVLGGSLYKTENGGLNWDSVFSVPPYGIGPFQVVNQSTIFVSNSSILYRSLDSGLSWEELVIGDSTTHYSNLCFYGDHGWITVGQGGWWTYESYLYKTDDGGMNWYLLGESDDYDYFFFTDQDTGFAVAHHSSWGGWMNTHIDKTTDGGYTWETKYSIGGEYFCPSFHTMAFANDSLGWAFSYGYSLTTCDGGESWEHLEKVPHEGSDILFIEDNLGWFINDYEIWKYAEEVTVGVEDPKQERAEYGCKAFPNPTTGVINLNYEIREPVTVIINIFNLRGELINTYSLGNQSIGEYQIKVDLSSQPDGLYFIRLKCGQQNETAKVLLIK